jgi:hypothetical protein
LLAYIVKEDDAMQGWRSAAACLLLIVYLPHSGATTVSRCEDAQGRVTFTTLGCPSDHSERSQRADNPPPGGSKPPPREKPKSQKGSGDGIRFAGIDQTQAGCGSALNPQQRRQAIIRQTPLPGMTRGEVESALGKPDRTSQNNGQLRYHYKDRDGNTRQVSFDEQGCVKGKR